MTPITATTDIATCVAFALTGPAKIKADDLTDGQTITLYEERSDGAYDPVRNNGVQVTLVKSHPSRLIEGYGNYKCLASHADLVLGYES